MLWLSAEEVRLVVVAGAVSDVATGVRGRALHDRLVEAGPDLREVQHHHSARTDSRRRMHATPSVAQGCLVQLTTRADTELRVAQKRDHSHQLMAHARTMW
jgi:hypothetical protein